MIVNKLTLDMFKDGMLKSRHANLFTPEELGAIYNYYVRLDSHMEGYVHKFDTELYANKFIFVPISTYKDIKEAIPAYFIIHENKEMDRYLAIDYTRHSAYSTSSLVTDPSYITDYNERGSKHDKIEREIELRKKAHEKTGNESSLVPFDPFFELLHNLCSLKDEFYSSFEEGIKNKNGVLGHIKRFNLYPRSQYEDLPLPVKTKFKRSLKGDAHYFIYIKFSTSGTLGIPVHVEKNFTSSGLLHYLCKYFGVDYPDDLFSLSFVLTDGPVARGKRLIRGIVKYLEAVSKRGY